MSEITTIGILGAGTMATASRMSLRAADSMSASAKSNSVFSTGASTPSARISPAKSPKAKLTQDEMDASIARIQGTIDRSTLAGCDFVIEAATEKFDIKRQSSLNSTRSPAAP